MDIDINIVVAALISGVFGLVGILAAAVTAYFVGRRQAQANVIQTETKTRTDQGAADVERTKQAVEVRLLSIEANQKEVGYYQNLVDDMKERVAEIQKIQTEAKNLQDSRIEELLTNIDGLIGSLAAADAKIETLQTQVTEGNNRISGLQEQVENSNGIITALQEQVVVLEGEIKEGTEANAALRLEVQSLLVELAKSKEKAIATDAALVKALE